MREYEHCGKCCVGSPCGLAEKHGMTSTYDGSCPAIVRSSGKYWCGLVMQAKGQDELELRRILKIGEGCHLW
jgi:hypothetical protein